MRKKPFSTEDPKRLLEYALWYSSRYPVSSAKLRSRLVEKCPVPSVAEEVFQRMEPLLNDVLQIESFLSDALSGGKSVVKLRAKLRAKGFMKEDIDRVFLEHLGEIEDFGRFEKAVQKKIAAYISRGYGKTHVRQELVRLYPDLSERIGEILSLADFSDALNVFLAAREGLPSGDRKAKQTLFAKLVRRGFEYDDVRRFLSEDD